MRRALLGSVVLVPPVLLGAALALAYSASQEQAVRAADLALAEAVASRDVERFKSLIADNGTFLGASAVVGPDEVAAAWAGFFDPASRTTLTWAPTHAVVAASGDLAFTIGDARLRAPDRNGNITESPSHYVSVWARRGGGAWQVAADGPLTARHPEAEAPDDQRPEVWGATGLTMTPGHALSFQRRPTRVVTADSGELAYSLGEYTLHLESSSSANSDAPRQSLYLAVWRRQPGGRWQTVAESVQPTARS